MKTYLVTGAAGFIGASYSGHSGKSCPYVKLLPKLTQYYKISKWSGIYVQPFLLAAKLIGNLRWLLRYS